MIATEFPVSVQPEAAVRMAELGLQEDVDKIIEYSRSVVPNIRLVEIEIRLYYEEQRDRGISVTIWNGAPYVRKDPIYRQWLAGLSRVMSNYVSDWVVADLYPHEGRQWTEGNS